MLDYPKYAALTFDCYGTLIDWESGLAAVLGPWAERSGISAREDELLSAFGEAESAAEAENPLLAYPDILRLTMHSISNRFGVAPNDEIERELARSVGKWPAFPDSAGALRRLKRHYRLAIVSNVDAASFAKSKRKLGVEFDIIITAENAGAYKPNLNHFEAVLARLSDMAVSPDRVLHVAQSLFHDHVPAKALGLSTVWINRRAGKQGTGATLRPNIAVTPDAEYPSMQLFADAVECAFRGPIAANNF